MNPLAFQLNEDCFRFQPQIWRQAKVQGLFEVDDGFLSFFKLCVHQTTQMTRSCIRWIDLDRRVQIGQSQAVLACHILGGPAVVVIPGVLGIEDLFLVPGESQPDFDFGQRMAGLAVAQNRRPIAYPTCMDLL